MCTILQRFPFMLLVCSLLVVVLDHIDSMIDELYPGLSGSDIYGNPLVKRTAPCPLCSGEHFLA